MKARLCSSYGTTLVYPDAREVPDKGRTPRFLGVFPDCLDEPPWAHVKSGWFGYIQGWSVSVLGPRSGDREPGFDRISLRSAG
jgi:hypothetical protein